MQLASLGDDVLAAVCGWLTLQERLRVRELSRALRDVSHRRGRPFFRELALGPEAARTLLSAAAADAPFAVAVASAVESVHGPPSEPLRAVLELLARHGACFSLALHPPASAEPPESPLHNVAAWPLRTALGLSAGWPPTASLAATAPALTALDCTSVSLSAFPEADIVAGMRGFSASLRQLSVGVRCASEARRLLPAGVSFPCLERLELVVP